MNTRLPRALALMALLALSLAASRPGPAAAQDVDRPGPAARPGRLFVFSVPGLTWGGVERHDLAALEGFFADAGLADLAPRGVRARSGPGDAYLTISAGARATTTPLVDGQVLGLAEQSSGSAAGEIFRRRTGLPSDGAFVSLSWAALLRANASEPYDAVPGLLADTLEAAGVSSTVIANADGTDTIGASYERQAGLAVADENGVVEAGMLGKDLLVDDPGRPFGKRLDHAEVVAQFTALWDAAAPTDVTNGGMVLVEASDLARTLRYRSIVGARRFETLYAEALGATDRLFGDLVAQIDADRDSVMVLAPYARAGDRDLSIVALHRPSQDPGYLKSASTQRSGFLTLVDVAPTILDTFGVARPVDMEGRPAELAPSSASYGERVDRLVALNSASRFRERLLVPTTMVVVLLMALVAAGTAVSLAGDRPRRWRRVVGVVALVDLAILPASYLARAFPLEDLGIGFYWAFVLGFAALTATAATMGEDRTGRPRLAVATVLALVASVPVIDVMTGSRLSLSAAFGYSPTGNSRLYGISNYSYGQLAAAVCLLAAMITGVPTRGRRRLAVGLLVATLVVLGVPIWGSDVGGVLAFTPSIALFVVLVFGKRIRPRTVVVGGLATGLAIVAFGLLDLSRPPAQRAHLGRLFERIGNEGVGPLLDLMERKLLANLNVSTSSFWVAAVPIALLFWLFVAQYPTRPLTRLRAELPGIGPAFAAAISAAALGSLVNDSGAIVGGVAGTVLVTAVSHVLVREGPVSPRTDRPTDA